MSNERSASRGHEFTSSGRGGLGNIHRASEDVPVYDGPDDFSATRGREPIPAHAKEVFSTGRGGAGNMRSPSRASREVSEGNEAREREILRAAEERGRDMPHSTGRGGLGNISRSRSREPESLVSRSRSREPVRSTGRGGFGNMVSGEGPLSSETLHEEDEERKSHSLPEETHATGRGGFGNITHSPAPPVEHIHPQHHDHESHGRGGAGNITHDRPKEHHGISSFFHHNKS
ncbi:hypothetical protein K523DRAFT_313427 [Schizophyllum commune Tattone D]|nr:hypothetical protein K523DRAFT_313427 [Schizophyllum commune Tattone D]